MSVASFVAAQRTDHGVPHVITCRAIGVSPSWFYKWRDRPPTPRQARRASLDAAVRQSFEASGGRYGSPRVLADLVEAGWRVSKKTVAASMARQGLVARPLRVGGAGLTRPDKAAAPIPDLVKRDFTAPAINTKWCGDLTEVPDRRRQAVPGHRRGPGLPADHRVRAVGASRRRARHRGDQDGRRRARWRRRRHHLPHRPGQRVQR